MWMALLAQSSYMTAGIAASSLSNDADGTDWAGYGRTYAETHYSPLHEIDQSTVSRLKLKWAFDLTTSVRADSQPLAAGGVLYVAAGLSIVHAIDARTGKLLWRYDPAVGQAAGDRLRPSWGIRGLAMSGSRLFVGTQDGRLIALDAPTGKVVWSRMTLRPGDETTITGAPRFAAGKVLMGFAGGERKGTRGAVRCYDAQTGKLSGSSTPFREIRVSVLRVPR